MMIPLPDGPISRVAMSSQAYGILKKAIIRGELKAGSRLLEEPLCQSLGISRSPLREAIRLLQADRLVEETGKGGVVVTQVLFDELPDLFSVRDTLETLATQQAAARATEQDLEFLEEVIEKTRSCASQDDYVGVIEHGGEFHRLVRQVSRNHWAIALLESLQVHFERCKFLAMVQTGRTQQAYEEHLRIWDAIKAKDGVAAGHAMHEHVSASQKATIKSLQDNLRKE